MLPNHSFTLAEWCAHRKVSRRMFYELKRQGLAPRTHNAGIKVLISSEADREWLAAREAEAKLSTNAAA